MSKSKGVGRAHICYEPKLSTHSPGRRHAQFDPGFQVMHQNEPTPAHPVSQHKQFKGHSTGIAHPKVPK
jgi:hypothetical protein